MTALSIAGTRERPDPLAISAHQAMRQVRDHAMFMVDCGGRIGSWNEGVAAVLGWSEADWLGQPLSVAFTEPDAAAGVPAAEMALAAANGRADDTRWMRRRSGEAFFAVGALTALHNEAGELVGFLKVVSDQTAARKAAEERERLLVSESASRAQAEQQAAALHAAIEAIPDAVFLTSADHVTHCNAAAQAFIGDRGNGAGAFGVRDLAERLRLRAEPGGPLLADAEHPVFQALAGRTAVAEVWSTPNSDGDVFLRSTAAPIVVDGTIVGSVVVNADLTQHLLQAQQRDELARVANALAERDQELRALAEGVQDYAIFTVGADGNISSWHEGAARMKGYTVEEAIGMPFARLFTEAERAAGQPRLEMEAAARDGEYKGEGVRLRKDGSTFDAAVVLTALRGTHGELLGYLKLTQDVTTRKRQEREREEMLRSAQAARVDAERANRSKGDFLATISHELRTPLGAILGWAQVLERGMSNADGVRQGLAAITRNARVQVQLIEDLLDMNRIESGQLRLDIAPTELPGVIAGAIETVLPTAKSKNITLRTVFDPLTPLVMGDSSRLQQIVWNLVANAVKFTPDGGNVTVALGRAAASERFVEITVSDSGQGIAQEFLPRVFERFQQQDATSTRRHGGLGIGLAIVRELAHLHGGSVRADSAGTGHGAAFTVVLPSIEPPPAITLRGGARWEAQDRHGWRAGERLDGVSVLLVDDDPDGRMMTEVVLRAAGASVRSAPSAEQGLELFKSEAPMLLISDIGMPVHDGFDLIRWVREHENSTGSRTVALALSAFAASEDRRRALAAGFQGYLTKPIEPAALLQALSQSLKAHGPPPSGLASPAGGPPG